MHALSIGQLARAGECAVQTVRHYEQIGILPSPARTAGNQRRYGHDHLRRLLFVRRARSLGLPLPDIAALLSMGGQHDASCTSADAIVRRQLEVVRTRMADLRAMEVELERMLSQCRGGTIADCRIIRVLSDHSRLASQPHGGPSLPRTEEAPG